MKKIRCMIVDDEKLGRELLTNHLEQLDDFILVASCASAIEASQVLNQQKIDLMFLDIEMPVLKGTDFYHALTEKPKVIFTTAYREYAVDGFELEAVDYILKPITFSRFFKACERFKSQHPKTTHIDATNHIPHLYVRANRKQIKLKFDEVLYIQSLKDYLEIHVQGDSIITKETMKAMVNKLPPQFIQVHRSYIVNQKHISAFTKYDIELNDIEIPIGETFQSKVLDILN